MKLIFDFDDVLFENTLKFKVHMFACFERAGLPQGLAEAEYKKARDIGIPFSLKKFIGTLGIKNGFDMEKILNLYAEMMKPAKDYLNQELLQIVQKAGVNDCYLVTNGDEEFQQEKLEATGIASLFKEIYIVPGSKKQVLEKICSQNPKDFFLFVEDREKFINDLDMANLPNLKVIFFDKDGLEKLKSELAS